MEKHRLQLLSHLTLFDFDYLNVVNKFPFVSYVTEDQVIQ